MLKIHLYNFMLYIQHTWFSVGISSTVDLRRWSGEEEVAVWKETWALVPSASCGFGKVQGFRVLSSLSRPSSLQWVAPWEGDTNSCVFWSSPQCSCKLSLSSVDLLKEVQDICWLLMHSSGVTSPSSCLLEQVGECMQDCAPQVLTYLQSMVTSSVQEEVVARAIVCLERW